MGCLSQPQEAEKDFAGTVRFCGKATDFLDHTLTLSWSQRKIILRREISRNAMAYVHRAGEVEAEAERAILAHSGGRYAELDAITAGTLASGSSSGDALLGSTVPRHDSQSAPSPSMIPNSLGSSNHLDKRGSGESYYASLVSKSSRDSPTDLYFAVAVMAFMVLFTAYAQWSDL